ncbi:glutamate---cysteine ligase / carboxylate-amine ligase [Marmoricola sp. URHA0025 HA25]
MRTVGVEEELILVDARTGHPRAVASQVLEVAAEHGEVHYGDLEHGAMVHELQQEQLETYTKPEADLDQLAADLRRWRGLAACRAAEFDAQVVASGTSPVPAMPRLVPTTRYAQMAERFGLTTREQLVCGCHVHVAVESLDEAVGVLDRIRAWLSPLLALTTNSPFWAGADSGYASYRSQVQQRWPTSGPPELLGSLEAYVRHQAELLGSGVPLDAAMIYTDARPSHHYSTIEIRVADVCADVDDAVLLAALCRGLVETAAREYAGGEPAPSWSTSILRLADWQAGRYGISDQLLDPVTARPRPAREVVDALVDHVAAALCDYGDEAAVAKGVQRIFSRGTGDVRQRAVLARTGRLEDVTSYLVRATAGELS